MHSATGMSCARERQTPKLHHADSAWHNLLGAFLCWYPRRWVGAEQRGLAAASD